MSAVSTKTRPELRQPVLGLPDPGERVPSLAWPTVLLYLGTLGLFGLEMYGVLSARWSPIATVPMGAAVTFLMFSVLHEATHHAISTSTRLSNLFGHLSVPFVVAWGTFPLVKFIHIEHHRNTNEAKMIDPDAWCDEGPWWQKPFRWATLDVWYLVFYARRLRDRPRREVVATLGFAGAVIAAFGVLALAGYGREILWGYLVPQRIGILFLAWWFDYLPHHGLSATQREDKYRATRVRVGGEGILTPMFVYQNYHLVHHLHPSVPFYRYLRAWRRNEQAYLDRNAAISTWFGRSLTASEYRTWRRITDQFDAGQSIGSGQRPVFYTLRVSSIEPMTSDSVVVTFEVPDDLAFRYRYLQGQHVTLRAIVDGKELRRSYSLVEAVSAQTIRVAVKQVEGGAFSTYVNNVLRVGDLLDVMTPTGQFQVGLDPEAERDFVGVAAGSGITVMMSTIATMLEVEPKSRFTLLYGNRTTDSTMFRRELEQLQDRFDGRLVIHHVLSREPAAPVTGRLSSQVVRDLVPDHDAVAAWFLCGPEQLVVDVKESLSAGSAPVLSELFHRDSVGQADIGVDVLSEVVVSLDGVETTLSLQSTGEPILDAALQAGIDPPYSCAGGACGTCRAKVLLGRAVMDQNHVLDDDEVARGYVLTCQAHPVTEEVRIDYDA
ncbi:MAG TPA: fatty acid desaturase [Aeromicrobium sp.]|nr:fatty acid desaturase [Aeromicrobium sp.]HKY59000.1 fatty acid desaturase [Aeromicrobium sp.]